MNLVLVLANGFSLLALSLIMFRLQAPVTFFRYDGTFILSVVKNQAEWMPGVGVFTMDFLKGTGGQWFPINTRLMPGFVIGLLGGDGDWLPALSATWFAGEFAVATIVISRTLYLPIPIGVIAVWIGLFGALPYLVPAPALERLWGNPHMLSIISLTTIALALFLANGRGSLVHVTTSAVGIFLILVYLTIVNTIFIPLVLPVLGFFGALAVIMANDRREIRWKLITALTIVILYPILFGAWLAGIFLYAKTTFFWSDMYPSTVTWRWASLLVEDPVARPAGAVFLLTAILGGMLTAIGGSGQLRRFAIGYLSFVALEWIVTGLLIVTGYEWPGPSVSYLDLMIYPLHAVFAAQLIYWGLLRITTLARLRTALPCIVMMATVLMPWTVLAVWVPPYEKPMLKNQIPFRWPPLRTPVVEFLERESALRPGEPFRGRVANLAGAYFDREHVHAPFINQHIYDSMVAFVLGNDHREYGLWFYNVPTLDDANHVASPFFHLLITRLLNPEGARFFRPHETASLFEPRILAQLGVRYVLTEELLPQRTPVLEIEMNETRKQYIYELKNANISGRSVTTVTVVKTAAQAVARLRSTEMDLEKEVVLFDALPSGSLVTVSRSRLEVHRGFLTLSAEAPGRALLVLPVEFSRCLEFSWTPTITLPPLALRANLDQTAILFSGQIEGRITLRNGPFVNPTCRLRELQDAVRVELGGTL